MSEGAPSKPILGLTATIPKSAPPNTYSSELESALAFWVTQESSLLLSLFRGTNAISNLAHAGCLMYYTLLFSGTK